MFFPDGNFELDRVDTSLSMDDLHKETLRTHNDVMSEPLEWTDRHLKARTLADPNNPNTHCIIWNTPPTPKKKKKGGSILIVAAVP